MNVQLLRVVRLVIRVDSDPARQALFARLVHAHRPVRLAFKLHERIAGSWASALLISCYGFASFLRVARPRSRRPVIESLRIIGWLIEPAGEHGR